MNVCPSHLYEQGIYQCRPNAISVAIAEFGKRSIFFCKCEVFDMAIYIGLQDHAKFGDICHDLSCQK